MKNKASVSHRICGVGITGKRAAGPLRFLKAQPDGASSPRPAKSVKEERERLQTALHMARAHTASLCEHAAERLGDDEAEIFRIHAMLLEDEDYLESIETELQKGLCAEDALRAATAAFEAMLSALPDAYLAARAADMRDIASTVRRFLSEQPDAQQPQESAPYLLVAEDLSPSETVLLDKSKILGFITFRGTPSSHTAILARAMGIPALVAVGSIPAELDGAYALLDAAEGLLTVSPTQEQISVFTEKQQAEDRIAEEHARYLRSLMNKPAVTKSGHRILIYANVGEVNEAPAALAGGADGIGLFRSEFLFLSRNDYPNEEEQYRAYAEIARSMEGRRTVIRTLDVGADKKISYLNLPEEENPALGFRAVRVSLARQELFRTQLRAILRASTAGRLALMIPLVVSVDEVRRCRELLQECKEELDRNNLRYDPSMEFGIMLETPAAMIMCEELAEEVDFFSVGTNDLCQYTLAADRQNPALDQLIRDNVEPILRMIAPAADAIHRHGGWIGICGELAADLSLTQRFADMRIDELSVSVPYLPGLRGKVNECH